MESDEFRIARGTKARLSFDQSSFQLGSSISNGETFGTWNEEGLDIKLSDDLRSADDVLMMARIDTGYTSLTLTCGAGTWATTEEHKKCSAQPSAECFVSSFRQGEKNKKQTKKPEVEKASKMTK